MLNLKQYNYNGPLPKPIFNTSFYSGQDLYSDGNIEDVIINFIANNSTTDYEQIISNNFSWPVFYHLTRTRRNLLNWYPFNDNSDILEIGCGMGALTELLCQKGHSVTSVELSHKRAIATYLRCRNYDNLEIIVGNLNDIKFNKKYDYITLIGVLEYQNNFTNSGNPFIDFLSKIRSLLKPNGKLLIAIENKYGIKYWCGVPEDHSGIPFDGINDYKFSNIAKTFSKSELNKLIINSGFKHSYFYYPLPDYKMPQVIYSENYLPKNGSLDNWIPYYSINNNSMISDEEHLYTDIVDNNVFEFFANSFLVECSIDNNNLGEIDYAVSSPFRKSEYDIITTHSKNKDFCKLATSKSLALLHNIDINHKSIASKGLKICKTSIKDNILYSEAIYGTPLTQILTSAIRSNNKDNIYCILDKIYAEIKKSSDSSNKLNEIFTNSKQYSLSTLDSNDKILSNGYIDMIHKNCLVNTCGDYIWIDQEWCINNIPASYILFHNIIELYSSNSWINSYISAKELLSHYNIINNLDCYFYVKNAFLNTVQNEYSAYNYSKLSHFNYNKVTDNIIALNHKLNNGSNQILSETEKKINSILENDSFEALIDYVNTLSDEIILRDIPNIPKFIVKYINSGYDEQLNLINTIKNYKDIAKII